MEEGGALSLHSFYMDLGIFIDDTAYFTDGVFTDSEADTWVHYTPSIENLVGEVWLVFTKWAEKICD